MLISACLPVTEMPIPIIDLFAGPGGLGEGFSEHLTEGGSSTFKIKLSIESDPHAHRTLELRTFFRQFFADGVPDDYYCYLRGEITREEMFTRHPEAAERARAEAWNATLGGVDFPHDLVRERIAAAIGSRKTWILIGGPPCQAYSLAGRSRKRPVDPVKFEKDPKHLLYKEYLRILADHAPPVFVMENVRGMLSSELKGKNIFKQICCDLRNPRAIFPDELLGQPLGYRLFPLTGLPSDLIDSEILDDYEPDDFVVKSEKYGIPQARHRVFLLGVRTDIADRRKPGALLNEIEPATVADVLSDLPPLRSALSDGTDNYHEWWAWLQQISQAHWLQDTEVSGATRRAILAAVSSIRRNVGRGGRFIKCATQEPTFEPAWFVDERIGGVCNHESRSHMREDLHRYLYAAAYAQAHEVTPKLQHFPKALLPKHKNLQKNVEKTIFSDRFRVQISQRHSTTVTSHISKDGHYYIHYDPTQCRSLTVREAARLQTFPDNYFFEGPRTEQYQQVGNAVPPLLALQIADIVADLLS
jgi:DNA (cytosine-5)-methyltransferase 1